MRTLSLFIFLGGVAAASCGSEDGGLQTPREFCARFAAAACNTEVVQACQAADGDACRASQEAFCLGLVPAEGFSGEGAERCLDGVEAAYADADLDAAELGTVLRLEAPCDRLASGRGGEGAACSDRRDCDARAGLECVLRGGQAAGTCQIPIPTGPGEDCSAEGSICGEGFYCDGSHCIVGEPVGEPCVTHEQCAQAAYCGLLSVCESRLPVRAPCGFDQQCASGLCYRLSATEQMCVDRLRLSVSEPMCEDLR